MALEFVSGFFVSSLLQELVDRVRASVADKLSLVCLDVEEELKNLEASYISVLSMLHNIDGWDLITSQPHQNWLEMCGGFAMRSVISLNISRLTFLRRWRMPAL